MAWGSGDHPFRYDPVSEKAIGQAPGSQGDLSESGWAEVQGVQSFAPRTGRPPSQLADGRL